MEYLKNRIKIFLLLIVICALSGCESDEFSLEENPQDQLSESTFWNNENDAEQAIRAVYRAENYTGWWNEFNGYNIVGIKFETWTDILSNKELGSGFPQEGITSTNPQVQYMWSSNYEIIARANYFLENIEKVDMNQEKRLEMIAEAKFLRSYSYFWLSQLFGSVPLVDKTLTFDEANNVTQSTQEEVVNFALNNLEEAVQDLPWERPASEKGRIEKGAALALMGRFFMSQEEWSKAAETYKKIIEKDRYQLAPNFKDLFEDSGDNSDEIIFSRKYMQDVFGEPFTQQAAVPGWFGGYSQFSFYQSFVDRFPMVDGQKIEESSLYDPQHPFEDRDPRLYATVLLPGYSKVNDEVYIGHPDSTSQTGPGYTGYGLNKFYDHDFQGNVWQYGGDYPLIRYAEVLLGYLESKIEAGDPISQNLLDETINKLRERESVQIAPVVETEPAVLRSIVRNERAIELAVEGGIRYWDLIRWKTAVENIDRKFYGMKVTENPEEYSGRFVINSEGHIFIREKVFHDYNYLWPIPQSELDVNPNLVQNPGYN